MNPGIRIALALGLAAALSGCRSPWGGDDLSAPCEWRDLAGADVPVSTADKLLPVVTADTPEDRWAAMFLAGTIEEISGRRPQVFVESEGQDCEFPEGLFIGAVRANRGWPCALTNESAEAFRVIVADRSVRFVGKADFAVFDWCERALGLRYYHAVGKCLDSRGDIVVRPVDYSDRPVFEYRELGNRRPEPWVRVAKAGVAHRGGVAVHQPHRWHTNETLKAERPGIFESGETPMLCYGNPETLAYYKTRIDRHIAGLEDSGGIVNTNRKVVTVCQWDAPIKCACKHCRGLYDPSLGRNGNASPIIWGRFLSGLSAWLAEAHPDYMISFLPYLNTCRVPRNPDFGGLENCEAEVCTMPGLALLKNRDCKRREEGILRDWKAATGRKVLSWDYSCWPQEWTSAPYVFGRTIRDHYVDLEDDLCGAYVCGGSRDPRLAVSMYVWMRCLWNPHVDVAAIYDGFARRMFGAAARPMRELIAVQEACWSRQWADDRCCWRNVSGVSFTREDVGRMKSLLMEAESLATAAGEDLSARRVRWYATGFVEFFAETEEIAGRKGRKTLARDETCEMVDARSALCPEPWAKTEVTPELWGDELRLRVRCHDPAAKAMDFSRAEDNFVWGVDSVTFAFEVGGEVRTALVDLAGGIDGGWEGFAARVTHDGTGWTVEARVRLTAEDRQRGYALGNVSRWRVGDRRRPQEERVPGSRYEHSRLGTVFTNDNDDPAAFVSFLL